MNAIETAEAQQADIAQRLAPAQEALASNEAKQAALALDAELGSATDPARREHAGLVEGGRRARGRHQAPDGRGHPHRDQARGGEGARREGGRTAPRGRSVGDHRTFDEARPRSTKG